MLKRAASFAILICFFAVGCKAEGSKHDNETLVSEPENFIFVEKNIYGVEVNKSVYCKDSICVRKCCDKGYIVRIPTEFSDETECVEDEQMRELEPPVYKDNYKLSGKKAKELFKFLNGQNIMNQGGVDVNSIANLYLLENGIMMTEFPNTWDRWTAHDNDLYCIDNIVQLSGEIRFGALILFPDEEGEQEYIQDPELTISGMLLSSVFLLATLIVYSFLPQLRNLHGKVLMAYVASMMFGFLTMGIIQLTGLLGSNAEEVCHIFSMLCYFFMQATFFWMNIMSFDIWWTFRGIAKARDINRRGENHKFLMYCLYGFGCPLGITIIFAVLNYVPPESLNPAILTPGITSKGCFIAKMEKMLYLYAPMSVLIAANCALFVATTWNLCAVRRATRTLRAVDNSVQRATQNRFILYVKVFLLMGVTWSLEVASLFSPRLTVWKFTDAWNLLLGVVIFFIFVCKKKIFRMLIARYRGMRNSSPGSGGRSSSRLTTSSVSSSSLDQDAFPTEIVTLDPKGHR